MSDETQKSDTVTIRKDSMWKYATFVLLAIVIIALVVWVLPGKSTTGNVVADNTQAGTTAPGEIQRVNVKVTDEDHIRGNPDANVVIVEYSDFECPYCARAYPTVKQLEDKYEDNLAVVYRHFPLSFHPQAQKAAEASECAAEQGMFWEMHDMLFEQGVQGGTDAFKQYASQLGLDTAQFNDCLDSGKTASIVQADMKQGQIEGIQGTPGFFVNGIPVSGAQPFNVFDQLIQIELA